MLLYIDRIQILSTTSRGRGMREASLIGLANIVVCDSPLFLAVKKGNTSSRTEFSFLVSFKKLKLSTHSSYRSPYRLKLPALVVNVAH